MKDKEKKKNLQDPENDEKIHVSQSAFKAAGELQKQRNAELEAQQQELERKIAEREKKKQEARDRRLLRERRELIRLKQGQIEDSEIIPQQTEEVAELTAWKKITNFFYHNKWWLGFGILFALIAVFLIHDLLSRENPDMVILFTAKSDALGENAVLSEYIEQFAEDYNNDGEVKAAVYYMPLTENHQTNYVYGTDTKMTVELQSGDAVIVIANDIFNNASVPENIFTDLSELYPDNPNVKGYAFYLKDTAFAERMGIDADEIDDDMYLAIRKPQSLLYCDEEEIQKTFDRDFEIFDKMIKDLTK